MHILLVNDDGPPSDVSPYVLPFFQALQHRGHRTHVVIPDKPMSWIGKAHAVGQELGATKVCPYSYQKNSKCPATSESSCKDEDNNECDSHSWCLLNGSPASCTQIGLYHCDWTHDDIEMVISGPNHGRNASTIYNLSSGTVGGALEGALCGKKSISLSFGSKEPQPDGLIRDACRRAVNVIEHLSNNWGSGVELYNVNVPMAPGVLEYPALFTQPSRSRWSKGSLFAAVPTDGACSKYKKFIWKPELSDIKLAAENASEGSDLWASTKNFISVNGLQANFVTIGQSEGSLHEPTVPAVESGMVR